MSATGRRVQAEKRCANGVSCARARLLPEWITAQECLRFSGLTSGPGAADREKNTTPETRFSTPCLPGDYFLKEAQWDKLAKPLEILAHREKFELSTPRFVVSRYWYKLLFLFRKCFTSIS